MVFDYDAQAQATPPHHNYRRELQMPLQGVKGISDFFSPPDKSQHLCLHWVKEHSYLLNIKKKKRKNPFALLFYISWLIYSKPAKHELNSEEQWSC